MFDLNDLASKALKKKVEEVIDGRVDDLEVIAEGTEVTIRGKVETEDDKKKVLADVQEIEGISKIITGLVVTEEEGDDEEEGEDTYYTVQPGDTLWGIAQKFYGNGSLYMEIYKANKDLIGNNPDLIKVGMELHIPK
jgi:nucleoid-associated protein YgaU